MTTTYLPLVFTDCQQLPIIDSSQTKIYNVMWKSGSDVNDVGESVRLYQPIQYKFTGKNQPSHSVIGGTPCYFENDDGVDRNHPNCKICHEPMRSLVQLHVPGATPNSVNRSLYIFSCNRASCGRQVFQDEATNFSLGGGGTFVCRRSQEMPQAPAPQQEAVVESPWGADAAAKNDDENDWDVDDGEEEDVEKMEAMLQDMEVSGPKGIGSKKKPVRKPTPKNAADPNIPKFTCYEIRAMQEPAGKKGGDDMDDEDDVGMAAGSDAKIQQMLARYMEEEDDEEILSALRGSAGGGGTEKDEKLPENDRAMLAFTDRVKRVPRQVLRYAKDGTPIWSIPIRKQQGGGKKGQGDSENPLEVPDCPGCGAKRVFECQLMPSLLHVLEVDKHALKAQPASAEKSPEAMLDMEFANGGQNWGTVAIYTCSESCESCRDEFVIVQNSMDGIPERRGNASMVVAVNMDDDTNENEDEYHAEE